MCTCTPLGSRPCDTTSKLKETDAKVIEEAQKMLKKGKSIEIPEHFIPSFKPAKVFTEQVKKHVTSLPDEEKED